MTPNPARLKAIFGFNIKNIKPLGACQFGCSVAFDAPFPEISPTFSYESKLRVYHTDLCALVDEVGVLVLDNAKAQGLVGNLLLSSAVRATNTLKQDPFHRDETKNFSDGITVLHNAHGRTREAPTIYATHSAVRAAISRYQEITEVKDPETQQALVEMAAPSYGFNLLAQDTYARRIVLNNCPDFTSRVTALIPDDQKYIHVWGPKTARLVLHSNRPNFILHARPEAQDRQNPLTGISVRPFRL